MLARYLLIEPVDTVMTGSGRALFMEGYEKGAGNETGHFLYGGKE
jgi:hypothetical protein